MGEQEVETLTNEGSGEMTVGEQSIVQKYCDDTLYGEADRSTYSARLRQRFAEGTNNVFVVPAYDEPVKNVERLVESINKASKVSNSTVGIILVVNNAESTPRDVVEINKAVIGKFLDSVGNVVVIDKVNDPLPDKKSGVGPARNIGAAYASEYFLEKKINGIVTHTDADSIVPEDFLVKQNKVYEDPGVDACTGPTHFQVSESNKMLEVGLDIDRMVNIYRYVVDNYLLSKNTDSTSPDITHIVHTAGSNMSSRAVPLARVNGIPELRGGEDVQFGKNLSINGFVVSGKGPAIISEFRESDRTTTGHGLGVSKIVEGLENGNKAPMVEPVCVVKLKRDYKFYFGDKYDVTAVDQIKNILGNEILRKDVVDVMKYFDKETGDDISASIADFLLSDPPTTVELKDVVDDVWDTVFSDVKHVSQLESANRLVEKTMSEQIGENSPQVSIINSILSSITIESDVLDKLKMIGIDSKMVVELGNEINGSTLEKSIGVYRKLIESNKYLHDNYNRLKAEVKMGILYDYLRSEMQGN